MKRAIFDIETNGLLPELHTMHSLVIRDVDSTDIFSCADRDGYIPLKRGLELLQECETIVGHNILSYDLPALKLLYDIDFSSAVLDTLVVSRLLFPEIREQLDFRLVRQRKVKPGPWMGWHTLESWGQRLAFPKDDYSKRMEEQGLDPWAAWSPLMQSYCEQDVAVAHALFLYLAKLIPGDMTQNASCILEHQFANVLHQQMRHGFPFDREAAEKLLVELMATRSGLNMQLQEAFPPIIHEEEFIPRANNKKYGYVKGVPFIKRKVEEFNPASRQQIAQRLKDTHGWEPMEFTDTGEPKVDESVLEKLEYPEAKLLNKYLMVNKRIGQLAEGKNGWLKKVQDDGRIYGFINHNGAVSGRCTHSKPNIGQVPKVGTPYGAECRALFIAPPGYKLVGCDASGLELRCLAHYMARYDGGKYRDILLEGDIHTVNQEAAGLPTRDSAKTFIYAFLYGAGNVKLGSILYPKACEDEQNKAGAVMKAKFLKNLPALKRLIEDVKTAAKQRKYLRGLDGRKLRVRSAHSALNLLLQGCGAVIMKKATASKYESIIAELDGIYGVDYWQAAHVHDEYQDITRPQYAESIGQIGARSITEAGEFFNFRCPLAGEYKIGNNWAETH